MKNKKLILILLLSAFVVLFFSVISVISTNAQIEDTVEESIANQNLQSAIKIAEKLDVKKYELFLENPEKNKYYWEIRSYLNDAREKIGALYVYTLDFESPEQMNSLIVGMPRNVRGFEIDDHCTVPAENVKAAYYNQTNIVTGIIEDKRYGTYMTVAVPIENDNGDQLGYLAIDISVKSIEEIKSSIQKNNALIFIYNATFIVIIILSFYLIQKWFQRKVTTEIEYTEDTYHTEIKNLIASVSSLRHDFTNHLQVIHGLLLLDEVEKAQKYTDSLVKEVKFIESFRMDVQHKSLAILLQIKKLAAQNHQIDFSITVSKDSFDKIKSSDLIKVLSNILDNAIEATIELPEEERRISLNCYANDYYYEFTVINTGPKIKDNEIIFKQGYSTKKLTEEKVRGQGLFIVNQTVTKYSGEIKIYPSDEFETTVIVRLPIR